MGKILDHLGINYTIGIDEAAFTVLSDFQIKERSRQGGHSYYDSN